MMRKVCCLILMALFACHHALPLDDETIFIGERAEGDLDWWEGGNFYQIYPRSWKDSDGNGIGDIPGITEKVKYLKDIGMDGVWLSPIFKSPMADFGYDISDYRDIYELFGTLEDFQALLDKCNEIGLKLILDLVPNHTSDEHEWFQKSERRDPGYENYYIWHPGSFDPATGRRIPPNNWISVFTGSAWKWSPIRKQFYYHAFLDKQPDLNYRNPRVVQEMKDVMTYWIEKGVAGFRIDAVPFCFEVNKDRQGRYPDEPLSGNPTCSSNEYCYHNHPYTNDQDETYDMVYSWRKHLNDFKRKHPEVPTKIMMIEAYTSLENKIRFYGDDKHQGAEIPFNFEMIINVNSTSTAADYMKNIKAWLDNLPEGKQANWVLGNHDNTRLASRLGPTRADMINIMLQTLPGVAVTYQGEEMALENVDISFNDTVDPQGCNVGEEKYKQYSRDPARTPFPWDTTTSAGFSTNETTWLPLGDDFAEHNVEVELNKTNSHLLIFKKLTALRKKDVMKRGSYNGTLVNNNNVIIYLRTFSKTDFVAVALNFGAETETVNFKAQFPDLPDELTVYTASLTSGFEEGSSVSTSALAVPSDVGVVLTNVVVGNKKGSYFNTIWQ